MFSDFVSLFFSSLLMNLLQDRFDFPVILFVDIVVYLPIRFIQVTLILRIRWPFSERKFSMTVIENNFDFDYIIYNSRLDLMKAKKKTFTLWQ